MMSFFNDCLLFYCIYAYIMLFLVSCLILFYFTLVILFEKTLLIFREKGREEEAEGEKH